MGVLLLLLAKQYEDVDVNVRHTWKLGDGFQCAWNTLADLGKFHQIGVKIEAPESHSLALKFHIKYVTPDLPSQFNHVQLTSDNKISAGAKTHELRWKHLIDLACRKGMALHAPRFFFSRGMYWRKITLRSAYTTCFFCETSWSLVFRLARALFLERKNDAEGRRSCGWSVEAPEGPAGTTTTKSGEFCVDVVLLSAWAFAENFSAEAYTNKNGKTLGSL